MNFIKISIILAVAGLSVIACKQAMTSPNAPNANTNAVAAKTTVSPPAAAPSLDESAEQRELYNVNCANCHKETGKGGKVTVDGKTIEPDDITSAKVAGKSDEKLIKYVTDGFPDDGMPAFKDKLTADQIKEIVKYVRTLHKS